MILYKVLQFSGNSKISNTNQSFMKYLFQFYDCKAYPGQTISQISNAGPDAVSYPGRWSNQPSMRTGVAGRH